VLWCKLDPLSRTVIYHRPTTLDEALDLKQRLGARGTFLAGGTDVVVGLRKGKIHVTEVIDLSALSGLNEAREMGTHLRIGAMCTHAHLERSGITALAAACETVGGPQIRNLGTIGGQLGTASPAGDVSVALIALNAEVEIANTRGTRRLRLEDLFLSPGRTALAPDEMILFVDVPLGRRSTFYKIGKRDAVAISLVMAAASLGPADDVALSLGCVAPVPFRPKRAEAHLRKHGLDDASIAMAAKFAAEDVSPISDHRGSREYRRAMVETLVQRLVYELLQKGDSK
jgi:CO/xanthine dehydrogenase FAD-binding subunit